MFGNNPYSPYLKANNPSMFPSAKKPDGMSSMLGFGGKKPGANKVEQGFGVGAQAASPYAGKMLAGGVQAAGGKMSSAGPWGALAAKGLTDFGTDMQEGGIEQHGRRIAAASLLGLVGAGPAVDFWDGWKK